MAAQCIFTSEVLDERLINDVYFRLLDCEIRDDVKSTFREVVLPLERARWNKRGGNPLSPGEFSKESMISQIRISEPEEIEKFSIDWVKGNVETASPGSFTAGESAAIINYKTPLHEAINNYLGYGKDFNKYPDPNTVLVYYELSSGEMKEVALKEAVSSGLIRPFIDGLDKAISKGKLRSNSVVYRGIIVDKSVVDSWKDDADSGAVKVFDRYTSTTLAKQGAEKWTAGQVNRKRFQGDNFVRVLIEGRLPAGFNVLDYPVTGKAVVGNKLDSLKLGPGKGGIDNEAELLLPRGAMFVVKRVKLLPDGQYYVKIAFIGGRDND